MHEMNHALLGGGDPLPFALPFCNCSQGQSVPYKGISVWFPTVSYGFLWVSGGLTYGFLLGFPEASLKRRFGGSSLKAGVLGLKKFLC